MATRGASRPGASSSPRDAAGGAAPAGAGHHPRLLDCPSYAGYDFGEGHPLSPRRLAIGLDLLRAAGLLTADDEDCPPPATDEELRHGHTAVVSGGLDR